ncbi:MAG: tetratricopeptide repeat protein [Lewinella sp.]
MTRPLHLLFLSVIFLSVSAGLPGNNIVDSLRQRLPYIDGEEKVEALLELADQLKFSDQEIAMVYAEEGLALTTSLKLEALEPQMLLIKGIILTIKADYPQSIQYYERAIEGFRRVENLRGVGKARNGLGMTYTRQGEYEQAMKAYEKAIILYDELADTSRVLLIKGNIANLAYKRGDYNDALVVYEELLDYGKQTNSKLLIGRYLGNIGLVYYHKGDYPAALEHFYQAVAIADSLGNKTSKVNLFNSIGLIYSDIEMYEEATSYFELGLELGGARDQGKIRTNLADLLARQGKYQEALIFITDAIAIYDSLGIKSTTNLYKTIALIQMETGDFEAARKNLDYALKTGLDLKQSDISGSYHSLLARLSLAQGDTVKGERQLQHAAEIFRKRNDTRGLYSATKRLASLYEAKGNYQEALRFSRQHEQLSDSLFGLQQNNKLTRVELERVRRDHLKLRSGETSKAMPSGTKKWGVLLLLSFIILTLVFVGWRIRRSEESEGKLLSDLQRAERENEEIKTNLKQTNLEMTFLSLDLAKKDDFLKRLKTELEGIALGHPASKKVLAMIRSIHSSEASKKEWALFQQAYEQVFPNFFDALQADYPSLTLNQLRHCGLIRLKISLQEVAEINAVSINSVHKARHRLREKFGLTRKEKLEHFLTRY